MSYKKKTEIGPAFSSILEFVEWTGEGNYVYFHQKPTHPGWARSWSLNFAVKWISSGVVRKCLKAGSCKPYSSRPLELR